MVLVSEQLPGWPLPGEEPCPRRASELAPRWHCRGARGQAAPSGRILVRVSSAQAQCWLSVLTVRADFPKAQADPRCPPRSVPQSAPVQQTPLSFYPWALPENHGAAITTQLTHKFSLTVSSVPLTDWEHFVFPGEGCDPERAAHDRHMPSLAAAKEQSRTLGLCASHFPALPLTRGATVGTLVNRCFCFLICMWSRE